MSDLEGYCRNRISEASFLVRRGTLESELDDPTPVREQRSLCEVILGEGNDPNPVCRVPGVSEEKCPLARYSLGEMDLDTAIKQLKQLMNNLKGE